MHILFVSTHSGGWGGSEHLWGLVAKEALVQGHNVTVSINGSLNNAEIIRELKKYGANIKVQKSISTRGIKGKLSFKLKKKYPGLFKRYQGIDFKRIDAICISQAGTYDVCYQDELMAEIYRFGIPFYLISQYHDEWGALEPWKYHKARSIFPKANLFYFVSERNKEICELFIAQRLNNAKVINNPFRLGDSKILPYPNADKKINFACVARLDVKVKCQNILLKILSTAKWKARAWVLNIYGEGKDHQYLHDLIMYFGLDDQVLIHGHVKDIERVWQQNHMLLLPSTGEGIPLSLIEAFAYGRPAITTDVGGNERIVKDGETGFLAANFSERYFGQVMESAWKCREKWKVLGEQAYDMLHKPLNLKVQKEVLTDIVNSDS